MSFRFFDRLARLVRADAHGVIGALEDRTLLLEQHLREAELALVAKRSLLEARSERMLRLMRALEAEDAEIARLDGDAELALAGGKDELARFALRRLLAARKRRATFEAERVLVAEGVARGGEQLAHQERRLEALRERVRGHRAQRAAATAARCATLPPNPCVADEEVALEMMRRRGAKGGEA